MRFHVDVGIKLELEIELADVVDDDNEDEIEEFEISLLVDDGVNKYVKLLAVTLAIAPAAAVTMDAAVLLLAFAMVSTLGPVGR